jgi:uncharacterized protein (TIGR02001 family)
MKRIFAIALAAAFVAATAPSVRADDADDKALIPEKDVPGKFTANVGLTSDYLFRGISQTDDSPAIQGGFDWSLDSLAGSPIGLYAGLWGSNVNFHSATGNSLETDWYGGFQGTVSPGGADITWKLGYLWYQYFRAPKHSNMDFGEIQTSLGHDFGPAALTVSYAYSGNFFGGTGDGHWVSAKVDIPIWKFTLSPTAGHQSIQKNTLAGIPDYWQYGAALTTKVAGFDMSVAVSDTDISSNKCNVSGGVAIGPSDACDVNVIFTVSRTF